MGYTNLKLELSKVSFFGTRIHQNVKSQLLKLIDLNLADSANNYLISLIAKLFYLLEHFLINCEASERYEIH